MSALIKQKPDDHPTSAVEEEVYSSIRERKERMRETRKEELRKLNGSNHNIVTGENIREYVGLYILYTYMYV